MSDVQRPPWWLSDEESEPASEPTSEPTREANWLSLLGSLGAMVAELASDVAGDWWANSGIGTHTEHADPTDHPNCVVCKTLTTVSVTLAEPETKQLPPVRWLPLRRL